MGAQVENRRTGPSRVVAGLALVLFVIVKDCLCFQAPVVPLRSVSLFPAHRRSSGSCVRKHRNAALAATVTETNCHTATRRHMLAKVLAGGVGLAFQGAQTALAADLEQYNGASPGVFVRRGMERFRRGLVKESIVDFDKAIELDASEAGYLWQRGLSLYYADRFEDASVQFRRDVALNPRDTEEAVWNFLSQARQPGGSVQKAQSEMISIVGETRPYMKVVYDAYAGKRDISELEQLIAKAEQQAAAPPKKAGLFSLGLGDAKEAALQTSFYGWLYLGLWAEANNKPEEARKCLEKAAKSEYGLSQDYMWYLAKVHCQVRGWQS